MAPYEQLITRIKMVSAEAAQLPVGASAWQAKLRQKTIKSLEWAVDTLRAMHEAAEAEGAVSAQGGE